MLLIDALRYSKRATLAFVGAGGKTTAIFRLARELVNIDRNNTMPRAVLVTTSTHLGVWQKELADKHICIRKKADLELLKRATQDGVILITEGQEKDRLLGLSEHKLELIQRAAQELELPLLIEADGSRSRQLKAPAKHEPAIPPFCDKVVVMASLHGLGKPLTEEWVHRADMFAALSGLQAGEKITPEALVKVLQHEEGGLKNIPAHAHKTLLLNQCDTKKLRTSAEVIAMQVSADYHSSVIASLLAEYHDSQAVEEHARSRKHGVYYVFENTAGVILAAGSSSRYGSPKQLIPWQGQPLVRREALMALEAGLTPVVVVLGASADEVAPAVSDLPVRIVNNDEWKSGISSSIRAGLSQVPDTCGGVLFFQVDQLYVSITLIKCLVNAHHASLAPITAPQVGGEWGNPVLFDQKTFPELSELKGEVGGKALFSRYTVEPVPWGDTRIFLDIDTPGDYLKILSGLQEGAKS